jgi:hypothetical protein
VAVAPSVVVRDVSTNPVAGVSVTFAIASGSGSVLPTTAVATNASGVAAVTSWTLGTTAGANSLTATAAPGGIAGNPVTFTATGVAGGAGKLAMFTQPPATFASGGTLAPAPVVQLQDVNGNPVTTQNVGITASIASGPGGVLSGGTVALTDANGRATFNSLVITGPTGSYMLQFNGASLTGVMSSTITLTAGAPARVAVVTQPTTAQSGLVFPVDPTVQVQDAAGNPVTGAGRSISVLPNSGSATLSGTLSRTTNAGGLATFTGLTLTGPVGPNTLLFSSAGLTTDTTAVITLTAGNATALEYVQSPTTVVAGQIISPAPTVRIRDGAGNTVLSATNTVTVALGANPGGSTLGGTLSVAAVAGVASFSTLSLNKSGAGYTLGATSGGLAPATSATFTVNPGVAAAIAITTVPATAVNGVALAPQPVVRLVDANGNTVPSNAVQVTAALASGSGVLGGTLTANTSSGVASFSNLALTGTVGAYTISFSSGVLTSVTSGFITLSAGAPAGLAFQVQPSSVASGAAITPAVQVRVVDGSSNLVTTATNTVAITIGSNPSAGVLSGMVSLAAAAGVATFSTLSLDKAGTGYSLAAASTGLSGATSNPFNVTAGAATQIAANSVTTQSATANTAVAAPPSVLVRDALNNPVAGVAVTFTVTAGGGSIVPVAATPVVTNASGIATLTSWTLGTVAGTNTVTATATGLAGSPVTFTATGVAGLAAKLAIVQQPSTTALSGQPLGQQPSVQVQDAFGNAVAGVASVSATLVGTGTLGGTTPVNTNASGLATFTDLSITAAPGTYTLNFTSGSLTPVTSGGITL